MDIFIYEWKVYVWNGVMIMTRQGNRKTVKKNTVYPQELRKAKRISWKKRKREGKLRVMEDVLWNV